MGYGMGSSFFQSSVWYACQKNIGKSLIDTTLGETTYWGVRRDKKIGPIQLSWDQFLGVKNIDALTNFTTLQNSSYYGDVFLQLGCDDVLWQGSVQDAKKAKTIAHVKALREKNNRVLEQLGFVVSWKENMPLATIITPCGDVDYLQSLMHKEHRRSLRHAVTHGLVFEVAQKSDRSKFYTVWKTLASTKGLGIMSEAQFWSMMTFLYDNNQGKLFVAKLGNDIVSGSVCVWGTKTIDHETFTGNQGIYYLYGATAREFGNVGGHVFLQHHIMQRGLQHGYGFFDHWGVAPLGYTHYLSGVSRFKERFGGTRVEYVGNFDVVRNRLLYKVLQFFKKH